MSIQRITPFLWFANQAEEAAKFYTSIFKNSRIHEILRYNEPGEGASGQPAGSVMTVAFELDGQRFMALNGGAHDKFNESISFVVHCDTQEEIDYYWERLSAEGKERQCGWLKDRYGVAWQVVPGVLIRFLADKPDVSRRVMQAMLTMVKLDVAKLEQAARG